MYQKRQSNFELLRIVSILLIIAHHFSVHSGFDYAVDTLTVNRVWIQCIQIGGKLGVNIFVLISGYFLCTAQQLKVRKVVKFLSQVVSYSAGLYLVTTALSPDLYLSLKSFVKACFPITYGEWWFASTYFVLLLLSPYLNKLFANLTRAAHRNLLLLLFVCWSVIPVVFNQAYQSDNLLWFMFLYAVAAYIRFYEQDFSLSGGKGLVCSGVLFLLSFGLVVVLDILGGSFAQNATRHFEMQQPLMLGLAVLMFVSFKNLKMPRIPAINFISQATFGIYLFHDFDSVRYFFWQTWFQNAAHAQAPYLIAYSLLCIAAVFVISAVVELIRIYAVESWWMNLTDKVIGKITKRKGSPASTSQ